ncbi:MAG: NTP transferase domain-containing protein [Acidilobus sp.]
MADELFEAALIMAGGLGSRLWGPSKPFTKICGRALVEHVLQPASEVSRRVLIALSPATSQYICSVNPPPNVAYIVTSGTGYEHDLGLLLGAVRQRPLLVLPADVVGLSSVMLRTLLRRSLDIPQPVVTVRDSGRYVGISVFKDDRIECWADLDVNWGLINVNTEGDYDDAVERC